jgi:hypothetical protein
MNIKANYKKWKKKPDRLFFILYTLVVVFVTKSTTPSSSIALKLRIVSKG